MAAGSDLLDEVFFNTEVDEKVVSDLVGSLECELAGPGHANAGARPQALANHVGGPTAGANVRESRAGLAAQEAAAAGKAGTRAQPQGGVINSTRSPASAAVDSGAPGVPASSALAAAPDTPASSASSASAPGQGGKPGVSVRVKTLNGGGVPNSHGSGSAAEQRAAEQRADSAGPAATPVNNGPGAGATPQGSVIQASFVSVQSAAAPAPAAASAPGSSVGPTVALARPPVHLVAAAAPGTTTPNGSGAVVASCVTGATPQMVQTAALSSGQSPKGAPPAVPQPAAPAGVSKSPVLQSSPRTATPTPVAAVAAAAPAAGIRPIAPQVLAPRLPQATQNPPNIQNIQLPPGMVLVRSDSGQLLMIHQQTLAQMQAQSQSQSAMTPRPATPTSTPQVQIAPVQGPGTSILTRQMTPTTIIKQTSPGQASVPATTTLQRPPVLQNPIVIGGAATATSIGTPAAAQPGAAQRAVAATPGATVTTTTETMENVKKCKNFLSTLIKLASSGKQSSETAANVKDLVKSLLEGKIEAEDFTSRLYRELNSSPQPYLVPFLKRSLPALRAMTPDSAAFIQQSQAQQPSGTASGTTLTTVVLGSSVQRPPAPSTASASVVSAAGTFQQPVISLPQTGHAKPGQTAPLVLHQSQQQGAVVRPPQVTLTQTPMVTLRPPHSRIVLGQPQVQVKPLQTVPLVKQSALAGAKVPAPPVATLSAAQKNKPKDAGGGTFRDDDDINDVASMAGVNLSEESARILATNSELVGAVTRSCKDEAFLYTATLHRRLLEIGKKYGIVELGPEVVNLVSHATQQRLQDLLEKVSQVAQQKNISFKDDSRHEQISDVRAQLKFFEQLDHMEKQKKEEQEREILLKAAKSRSRQEDPEQLRLKQKAKEMQQQELAQMRQRDANLTALAAIGPRKKRKLDWPGGGAGAEGSGSSPSLSGGSGAAASRQFTRQRITRVNLRDLLFCLENEKGTSHSHLLYRAFLK
ncbi:transcription initiation factor TFIID subunit 4 [Scleropages formosus]|uniref:transcription initiation factor TFIID subunit 4 n=1 Tax=Scleropages formosus TaxID=113540 RepID=UPI0010FAA4A2|nr:transcription initiation factor TFIID subunit 4 [Scleropages formosus]